MVGTYVLMRRPGKILLVKKIMKIYLIVLCAVFCLCFVLTNPAYAQVRLTKLISSGMVLQRDQPLKIWGWASPAERVSTVKGYKQFVWAEARIIGNGVVVSNDEIADPKYVKYAKADNPDLADLYNKEGFPASSFEIEIPGNN